MKSKKSMFPFAENHKHHWSEEDIDRALEYLERRRIGPGDLTIKDVDQLNEDFSRYMELKSWQRTFQRWIKNRPIKFRPMEPILPPKILVELQELREIQHRAGKSCDYLTLFKDGKYQKGQLSYTLLDAITNYLKNGNADSILDEMFR